MRYILSICFIFLFLFLISAKVSATNNNELVVSRLMINPTSCGDFDCEWIELHNTNVTKINLTNYSYNGTKFANYELEANEKLIVAKELLDTTDSDTESFEARWGDNTGVWGDSESENIKAIDDSSLGIQVNLVNTTGSVVIKNLNTTYTSLFSWSSDKFIFYINIDNTYYGFNAEDNISLTGIIDTVKPINKVTINNQELSDNDYISTIDNHLIIDTSKSIDNTYIVKSGVRIYRNNLMIFDLNDKISDITLPEVGDYSLIFTNIDINDNESKTNITITLSYNLTNPIISEIYPGDDNKNGWIEIYNPNDFEVGLGFYEIKINETGDNIFKDQISLKSKEYFVIKLDNKLIKGQCINYQKLETLINTYCLPSIIANKSYSIIEDKLIETILTPGNENLFIDQEIIPTDAYLDIQDITDSYINKSINIKGVITNNLLNSFDKSFFYLQSKGKAMKIITDNKVDYKENSEIEVNGILNKDKQGLYYIKLTSIKYLGQNSVVSKQITVGEIDLNNEGLLVNLNGVIEKSNGSEFYLSVANKVIKVMLNDDWQIEKHKGDSVNITGVISYYIYSGEIRYIIFPIGIDGVVINNNSEVLAVTTSTNETSQYSEVLAAAGTETHRQTSYIFSGIVLFLIVILKVVSAVGIEPTT